MLVTINLYARESLCTREGSEGVSRSGIHVQREVVTKTVIRMVSNRDRGKAGEIDNATDGIMGKQ